MAGAGAVAVLAEQLEAGRAFARASTSPTSWTSSRRARPCTSSTASPREIAWPSIDFVAGRAGRDVVLCSGPEPSLRWRAVLGEIVDAATRLGVTRAFTLGGIPSMASHRRPVQVLAHGDRARTCVAEAGAWRNDYTGPTGAQSVLQVMLGEAGVPTRRAVGPGAALRGGRAVAARDPRRARASCATSAGSRSTSRRSTSRPRPTCSGSRRASPTVPTSSRRSRRSNRHARRGDRAAAAERRRARVGDRAVPPRPAVSLTAAVRDWRRRAGGPGQGRPGRPTRHASIEHPARCGCQRIARSGITETVARTSGHRRSRDAARYPHGPSDQSAVAMSVVRINAITRAGGAGRRARGALRRAGRRGVELAGLRGVRAAAPDRRPRRLPRVHALALGGRLPGLGEQPRVPARAPRPRRRRAR